MADEEVKTEEVEEKIEEAPEESVSSEQKGSGLRFKKSGGVCRKCRRAGEKLFLKGERCFSAKCSYTRRSYAPGQHGNKRQIRLSQYGLQLREKQKLSAIYNLREKQLLKNFTEASKKKGKTGEILISLLERRLDNVIYRAGLAVSRRQAKQLIRRKLFMQNGRSVDIASIKVKQGDVIKAKENLAEKISKQDEKSRADAPKWLGANLKTKEIKIIRLPERIDTAEPIDEQLIVEFYSK